jgi:CheY-like chemotaxis protein
MAVVSPSGHDILIIEDDEHLRETLAEFLADEGYDVAQVADGQAAIDELRHAPLPRLILLDLMPPGMYGWEFWEQLQQDPILGSVPVVVVSAGADNTDRAGAVAADGYLQKPIDINALFETVAHYCR